MNQDTAKVIIYTTPTCAYCHMAKEYLDDKGVKFKEIDISDPKNEASLNYVVEHAGMAATPYITVGEEGVLGFDQPKIEGLLEGSGLLKTA